MTQDETISVTFSVDRDVRSADGTLVNEFKAGQTYNLTPASAARWERRNCAVINVSASLPDVPPEPLNEPDVIDEETVGGVTAGIGTLKAVKSQWVKTLEEAGFDTIAKLAEASVDDLDATDCKRLGPGRAMDIIAEAKTH